ncbi:MAG: hypothetical protein EPN91_12890 [Salinibacterium sp.]|nr:MAG: hypothetical protein EPN91_12890 [Salinibacterium sp.]
MADTRRCSWPGCKSNVPGWRWGCGTHWAMLPSQLQDKINLGMQDAWLDAQAWIQRTFGVEPKVEYEPAKWERLVRMVRDRDAKRAARRWAHTSY